MKSFIALATVVLLSAPSAFGAEQIKRRSPDSLASVEWKRLAGYVEAADLRSRKLRVRDRNGNIAQVTIDDKVQIFKHWRLVALNDISVRDHVILKRSETGMQ
jgi:hypothetical protein